MDSYDDDEDEFQSSADLSSGSVQDSQPLSLAEFNTSQNNATGAYENDYFYADELEEAFFKLDIYPFETTLLGIVRPFFILLTILTNAVVVGFFFSMKNRRNASNLLFISIAVSDTMSSIASLPNSFHVYDGESKYLSRNWCMFYIMSRLVVSRMFHTVSIWQTVLLGIQRHLCVCYPFLSGRLCTFWKTFVTIIVFYVLAFCFQLYHVIDDNIMHGGECGWSSEQPCLETCIYLWASLILQQMLPSLILLVLTILTLVSLRKASNRASEMSTSQSSTMTRSSRDRILTITTILIVIVFLIPEVPFCVFTFIITDSLTRGTTVNVRQYHLGMAIYEVVLTITFHANFWIYCITMNDFRKAVLDIFACWRRRNRRNSSRKFSRSSSSRSARANVSRTSSAASRHRVLTHTTSALSTTSDIYLHPISPTIETHERSELSGATASADAAYRHPEGLVIRRNRHRKSYKVTTDNEGSIGLQPGSAITYLPHTLPSTSEIEAVADTSLNQDVNDTLLSASVTDDKDTANDSLNGMPEYNLNDDSKFATSEDSEPELAMINDTDSINGLGDTLENGAGREIIHDKNY